MSVCLGCKGSNGAGVGLLGGLAGSCKWGYKSPNLAYVVTLLITPLINIATHEPPSKGDFRVRSEWSFRAGLQGLVGLRELPGV